MKKVLLFISLFMFFNPAQAACNYMDKCPCEPYELSGKVGQIASEFTGMNFIAERVADALIKSQLKKATKEKFKVNMQAYSLGDLAKGRFKSLEIEGKNLDIDGVYLSSLNIKTLCDYNSVELSKNSLRFRENMVLGYAAVLSDMDLRKTMKSSGYLDMLNGVNLSAMGVTFLKLDGADVKIKNNKIYFIVKVTSQLLMSKKPMEVVVSSDIKVEDGRIVLTKVEFANLFTRIDLSKITYLLNAIDPLTFSLNILNNKDSKMSVQNVNIIGDRIIVNGVVFVPKNTVRAK